MEDWLVKLYAELDKQGITIPERYPHFSNKLYISVLIVFVLDVTHTVIIF